MERADIKTVSHCDCPNGRSKDVIVITIETCCKRNCDGIHKAQSQRTTPDEHDEKLVESSPSVREVTSDESEHQSVEPQRSEVQSEQSIVRSHEPSKVKINESQAGDGEKPLVVTKHSETEVKIVPEKQQRLFKLPLLVDRHHGAGCAMEISVLEKHEQSCIYKKSDVPGRSIDDKVGSYDCIGRLVFRTCNSNELESDSSGSQGTNGGFTGTNHDSGTKTLPARDPSRHEDPHVASSILQPSRHEDPHVASSILQPQPHPTPRAEPSQMSTHSKRTSLHSASTSDYDSVKSTPSPSPSGYITPKSEQSHLDHGHAKTESKIKHELVEEEAVVPEKQEPVQSSHSKRRHHQIMITTNKFPEIDPYEVLVKSNTKKHYPGDDCKLHVPRNPLLFGGKQMEKIYTSKKTFPVYTDEGNQTDVLSSADEKSRKSEETISSLTDLSKSAGKRKSSFLGSLFRKGSIKSSSTMESKRPVKR